MYVVWRHSGLMVSALTSGSSSPDLSRGQGCCVLGQDTLLSQCLSPPRCIKLMGAGKILLLGVTLPWTSIPSREEQNYS